MDSTNVTNTNEENNIIIPSPPINNITHIDWTEEHEQIMIDWADKALCYKWLHQKSHSEYRRKNTWFTIPVIIMSTLTGTANFAQDRIPPEHLNLATMIIGGINLIAGILTTIQQFLKITELNEAHRVSSIAWGKFYRNVKVEISKSPNERSSVVILLKHSKEEFDRLIETSPSLSTHVIRTFMNTFSGGEPERDAEGNEINLTKKQKLFNDLKKPEICGTIETTATYLYKRKEVIEKKSPVINPIMSTIAKKVIEQTNNRKTIEKFIDYFEKEKKRIPTKEEIINNLEPSLPNDIIESVYSEVLHKKSSLLINSEETNV